MTVGVKIAIGVGVVAVVGLFIYRRVAKPKIKITHIDNVAKEIHFIMNGSPTKISDGKGIGGIGKAGYAIEVSKDSSGDINGINLTKYGAILETITMVS
jgi:hypothetical protein